jgi:simple sugar transport system permease protein
VHQDQRKGGHGLNTINFITNLLAVTLAMGTSLTYATLGEVFTEKSGILNLGMEGVMLMGALSGFATVYFTSSLALGSSTPCLPALPSR